VAGCRTENRALIRGLSLSLATALLALAFMTQSRGAVWSLGFSLVLTFIVSPARLRTLFYLCVPALSWCTPCPVSIDTGSWDLRLWAAGSAPAPS